jgi:hypothetical protein
MSETKFHTRTGTHSISVENMGGGDGQRLLQENYYSTNLRIRYYVTLVEDDNYDALRHWKWLSETKKIRLSNVCSHLELCLHAVVSNGLTIRRARPIYGTRDFTHTTANREPKMSQGKYILQISPSLPAYTSHLIAGHSGRAV